MEYKTPDKEWWDQIGKPGVAKKGSGSPLLLLGVVSGLSFFMIAMSITGVIFGTRHDRS